MKLTQGQPDQLTVKQGTYGGLLFSAYIFANTANVPIVPSDWLPLGTQVQVTLNRGGQDYPIMNDNLLLLGTYNMRKNNYFRFTNGFPVVAAAGGIKASQFRSAYIAFRSPVRVDQGDSLTMQISFNSGFSANVDTSISYLDIIFSPTIGYEVGIPQTRFKVVQTASTNDDFVNADGVKHIEFINFDQSSLATPVISNISVASDKLSYNTNFMEAISADATKWPMNVPYQFTGGARLLDLLPQSFTIFEAGNNLAAQTLNGCRVTLNFNSGNVNASQNWVGHDSIFVDARNLKNTVNRIAKHANENIARVATGTGM